MSAGAGRAAGRPLPPASIPSRPPGPWFQRPGLLWVGTLPSAGLAARGSGADPSGVPGSQPGEGSRPRSMTTQEGSADADPPSLHPASPLFLRVAGA